MKMKMSYSKGKTKNKTFKATGQKMTQTGNFQTGGKKISANQTHGRGSKRHA